MASIIDGLFSGRAGIQSHGIAIAVIADNIANQNTVGFKSGRADFTDLLAGSLGGGGGAVSPGSGSAVKSVTRILNQGTFEFTGRDLDIGIDGNGFLLVRDGTGSVFYTRAGNLSVDAEGNLRDQNNFFVLGYSATGSGELDALNVSERVAGDIATTNIDLGGNLRADGGATISPNAALPPGDAGASYAQLNDASSFAYSVTAYDSLGGKHNLRAYFFNTDPGNREWSVEIYADGGDINNAPDPAIPAGTPVLLDRLPLLFQGNGQLVPGPPTAVTPADITWANGSDAGVITFDFSRFTQFASPSSIESSSQNGTGSGSVVGYSIEKDGSLRAQLDNGQSALVGTIGLATFANNEGLKRVGNSLYTQTAASGEPIVGTPSVGTFGLLESGALELSTSDLAGDFIKLISLQRGFQGSSRIVSSISDLLNEVVNLAR